MARVRKKRSNITSRPPSGKSHGGRAKGVSNSDKAELRAMTQDACLEFTALRRRKIEDRWVIGDRPDPSLLGVWIPFDKSDPPPDFPGLISSDVLDELQPAIEEYDPVVELSLIAVDYRNDVSLRRQASSDAAQYLRPKLKSIEVLADAALLAEEERRGILTSRLIGLMDELADEKRDE